MTTNAIARAETRRMIMESVRWLVADGRRAVTRDQIVTHLGRGVSPRVFAHELRELCIAGRLKVVRESSGARPALYEAPEMTTPDDDRAPDWKPGYPSTGERIGPAWAAMWAAMPDGEWVDAFDLAIVGAEAGGILPGTARNLLFPAAQHGLVEPEARYDEAVKRWRTWYRRTARVEVGA